MTDLNERLRGIDRLSTPDLWEAAQARAGAGAGMPKVPLGRRFAIIAASLAIGFAAVAVVVFAFREPGTPSAPVDEPFAWPKNSCELVTVSEVEAATHSAVIQSGLITDDQLMLPGASNPCQYETDDEHTSLDVLVRPDDVDDFIRVRDGDPANVVMLPGLGDEAFSTGLASVWVRVGSGHFVISSQHGAGREGVSELKALARLALGAHHTTLLVSSSGPSGAQALLTGTLTAQSGCLGVSTGPDSFVHVVWPAGYSLAEADGETWLVDDSGNPVAKTGDEIEMGGGITNLAHAEPSVPGGIPSSCEVGGPDAYWFAGVPEVVSPSEPDSEVEAARMPGIDTYKVCRVMSLPGDFGDAGDEVVVFEEENTPGYGCVSEGFQHVAVLRDGQVTALSRRITDLVPEAWKVWPYATPDLDGDGQSEIAVALAKPGTARRLWFFTLAEGGGGVEAIYENGGPFTHMVGSGRDPVGSGESGVFGVYCEGEGGARRIVTWSVTAPPGVVAETRWRLSGPRVEPLTAPTIRSEGQGDPEVGDEILCESPASPREEYPSSEAAT